MQAGWLGLRHAPKVVDLDGDLLDGDRFGAGSVGLEVLHTPGHTPGSVCFSVTSGDENHAAHRRYALCGSIGRWDLEERRWKTSCRRSPETHGLQRCNAGHPGTRPFTTIGTERNSNPYLALLKRYFAGIELSDAVKTVCADVASAYARRVLRRPTKAPKSCTSRSRFSGISTKHVASRSSAR